METPKNDALSVTEQISLLQREPFRKELARLLDCAPTEEALQAFADKSPDRWAQAVSILARQAGYTDKVVHETNIYMQINQLPDAGLERELKLVEQELAKLNQSSSAGELIDGQKENDAPQETPNPTEDRPPDGRETGDLIPRLPGWDD